MERSEPRKSVRAAKRAEIATYIGQFAPIDQRAAQDDVRCQILHDDQRLRLVEEENLRHHTGSTRSLAHQRVVFEEGAFQRQRPALADKANIGQGLLDDRRAFAARDDEHEVEVAVADLLDGPVRNVPADLLPESGIAAEPMRQ
jgi:hypothetical protein